MSGWSLRALFELLDGQRPKVLKMIGGRELDFGSAADTIGAALTRISELERDKIAAASRLLSDQETIRLVRADREEVVAERDAAKSERQRLEIRVGELLQLCARLTAETPFPDEFKGWEGQRAAMTAEVGTCLSG